MYNGEVVHILQAIRNAGQLKSRPLVMLLQDQATTYKLGAIYVPVRRDELVDISMFHPLRNESKPVLV